MGTKHSAETSKDFSLTSIDHHNCSKNCPELKDLLKYFYKIASNWKYIALQLGVTENCIMMIDIDHPTVEMKCYKMFKTWLEISVDPCWCHFVKALYDVGLFSVAEEARKRHLQLTVSSRVDKYEGNIRVICLIIVCK